MSHPSSHTALAAAETPAAPDQLPAKVIGAVVERIEEMLDAVLRELRVAIPSYVELDDQAMLVEERARLTALTVLSLRAVLGHPLDETLIEAIRRTARRRAVRGFPLSAMLRSNDVKVRVVWDFVAEELFRSGAAAADASQLAIELSTKLLDASAQLRQEETGAYLDAEREQAGTGEQTRRRFLDDLLGGEVGDPQELRERAHQLGYQLGREHAVAVVELEGPGIDDLPSSAVSGLLRRLSDAIAFAAVGNGMPLVQSRRNAVIAVLGASRADGEQAIRPAIEQAIGAVQAPEGCQLMTGLGRIEPALAGIAVSHKQALRALEAARLTGVRGGLVSYADMLPSLLLLSDPDLARDSRRATVEPLLAYDAANGTNLVETLSVFLSERGVLGATAKRLYVHRHTLTPRLELIEQLTGHSLQDRNDLFMLELGLRAQTFASEATASDAA